MMELGASGRLVQLSRGAFLGRVIVPHILTAPGGPRYTRQPAKAHSQDLQNTKHGPPLPAASRGASSLSCRGSPALEHATWTRAWAMCAATCVAGEWVYEAVFSFI